MAYRVKLEGVRELREALRKIPPDLTKKGLDLGCAAAAEVYHAAQVSTVPRGEGTLAASLTIAHPRSRSKLRSYYVIGPGPAGFYGRYLEWGTSTIPARAWMRPAFIVGSQPALNAATRMVKAYFP